MLSFACKRAGQREDVQLIVKNVVTHGCKSCQVALLSKTPRDHVEHHFLVLRLKVSACVLIALLHPLNDSASDQY